VAAQVESRAIQTQHLAVLAVVRKTRMVDRLAVLGLPDRVMLAGQLLGAPMVMEEVAEVARVPLVAMVPRPLAALEALDCPRTFPALQQPMLGVVAGKDGMGRLALVAQEVEVQAVIRALPVLEQQIRAVVVVLGIHWVLEGRALSS